MSFFTELKRRNVFRAAIAYISFAWMLLQIVDFVLDVVGSPAWILQTLVVLAVAGLPVVVVFAWVFELTPDGFKRDSSDGSFRGWLRTITNNKIRDHFRRQSGKAAASPFISLNRA